MFDFNRISNLTSEDVIIVNKLQQASEEAYKAADLIKNSFRCFAWGEEKIEVYRDDKVHRIEYLTYNGHWIASYPDVFLDIECTPEGLFEYFKAAFLLDNNFVKREEVDKDFADKAVAARYLKVFLERIGTKNLSADVDLK